MKMYLSGLVLLTLLIPFPSVQHFIWPPHWCLLADICNHTWIPECGEEEEQAYTRRLFIDECDLYEYNCDSGRDYDVVNYSDCFGAVGGMPCPSIPTCPDHKYHRMGQNVFTPARRMMQTQSRPRRTKTTPDLPPHMLKGKRRYTPKHLMKRRHTTTTVSTNNIRKTVEETIATTLQTIIIKKEKIVRNGRTFERILKGIVKRKRVPLKDSDAEDFLEK